VAPPPQDCISGGILCFASSKDLETPSNQDFVRIGLKLWICALVPLISATEYEGLL
jgi:hypothetical protein